MENQPTITVAIVEDDDEIRGLLELLIDKSPGFSCKQVFSSCSDGLEDLRYNPPDVVLMDVEMPAIMGTECVKRLKLSLPDTDFLMLTIRDDNETIFDALSAGATGYLLKDTPPARLLTSIREIHEGGSPMTPAIARKIAQYFHPTTPSPLSERETQILQKLCEGSSYTDVAEELFISGNTVKAHIKNIYSKLHVNSRGEAVSKAMRNRLV